MPEKSSDHKIPTRDEVPPHHCWDLSNLFKSSEDWEKGLKQLEEMIDTFDRFKGELGKSPERLLSCLQFNRESGILAEALGNYAQLRVAEDGTNSGNQGRFSRYMNVISRFSTAKSYQIPEIQRIPDHVMRGYLENEMLSEFLIYLKKILRYKPHVLGEDEEKLLAMQIEFSRTSQTVFSSLTNLDMDFGSIHTPEGEKPLTQSTYNSFIIHQDRKIRRDAYLGLLNEFESHKHALAGLYNGSVQLDIYNSKARKYSSSLDAALFPDKVPLTVYTNLIDSVHKHLDTLHHYYEIRRKALGLDVLHLYDTRVPLVADIKLDHTYEQAVEVIIKSLARLGDEYTSVLKEGLLGKWVDRYENQGKRAGAFSAGAYTGDPYILINFKDDAFDSVFTLAHEGGHSMHSWYSAAHNPFQHYDYTIFVAEVASTFNEQLLSHDLIKTAENSRFRAYLINKQIDDIIGTIFRQTMFAEYEKIVHEMAEDNQPLTIESLRKEYRKLLELYFGSEVQMEDISDLEGLRIPHFYRAFYVYKYATGLSAAIALSKGVIKGGSKELDRYLSFLKSGGSKFPLDQLKDAGVDLTTPEPFDAAMDEFKSYVDELEELLKA